MGESSQFPLTPKEATVQQLFATLRHEYPQAKLEQIGNEWVVYTVHGVGNTEEEAIRNASREISRMQNDGRALPQILDEVTEDLNTQPGMSKSRHESLTEVLNTASNCLNDGILTNTIPFIMFASYTRKITDLQRRVDMRLAMTAKEMADRDVARKRANHKPERRGAEYIPGVGIRTGESALAHAMKLVK